MAVSIFNLVFVLIQAVLKEAITKSAAITKKMEASVLITVQGVILAGFAVLSQCTLHQCDELPPEFSRGAPPIYLYQNQAAVCIP